MLTPISELRPPSRVLRPVDPGGLDMALLTDSLNKHGLLVPITICRGTIVDGYRRWLIYKARGWAEIEAHAVEGDPDTLRVIVQTRHTEFARADKRALLGELLVVNPELTATAVSHRLQWSPAEVESLAGTDYLITPWERAYAAGQLSLAEVWYLSRIQDEAQHALREESTEPLLERARAMLRETRSARRRAVCTRPRGKSLGVIAKELEQPTEAGIELIKADAHTATDGWNAALKWILGKDQKSI